MSCHKNNNLAPHFRFAVVAVSALCAACAWGGDLECVTVDGRLLTGSFQGWSGSNVLLATLEGEVAITVENLHHIRPVPLPAEATSGPSSPNRVLLWDGTVLAAGFESISDDRVVVLDKRCGRVSVPLQRLRAARCSASARAWTTDAEQAWDRGLLVKPRRSDTLLLQAKGKIRTVDGALVSLGPQRGEFSIDGQQVEFDREKALAVLLADVGAPRENGNALCALTDGTRIGGNLEGADETGVRLDPGYGKPITLLWREIVGISFASERITYLSDLEPRSYDFTPSLAVEWPYRNDRNVANGPIRLDDREYARGIGLHSTASLTYDLDGRFESFAALVGIDDGVRPKGDATCRILMDGKEIWRYDSLKGTEPAQYVSVPVPGALSITLVVDIGRGFDVADRVNWAEARMVRPPRADLSE